MVRQILTWVWAAVLVCAWAGVGGTQEIGYTFKSLEQGFAKSPPTPEPNSTVVLADAAVARPVGLAMTIAGTGLFLVTLPMTAPSGGAGDAARGLIGKVGGWTFCRPLGRSAPEFEDTYVFPR